MNTKKVKFSADKYKKASKVCTTKMRKKEENIYMYIVTRRPSKKVLNLQKILYPPHRNDISIMVYTYVQQICI